MNLNFSLRNGACSAVAVLLYGLFLGAITMPVAAQQAMIAQPVVQPIPGAAGQALNAALARLGKNPRDVSALIDAGNAALVMGDVDAAVGFFARADQLQPNNPRVRAGLAGALVHSGNPYDAIPLFAEAEAADGMTSSLNAERGLAYDLVGDTATAQKYYRAALASVPNDETTRRLGLSQAIAGDRDGMEATLSPLLLRQDTAAMRMRAFGLAILGRADEAVAIAQQVMPAELSAGIAPYLRYMPRLTKAQQAAAATFGHFPRAAEIGRDDPRVTRYAPPAYVATATALVPKGEPLGGKSKKAKAAEARIAAITPPKPAIARVAPPELQPRRVDSGSPAMAAQPISLPVASAPPPPPPPPTPVVEPVVEPVVVATASVPATGTGGGVATVNAVKPTLIGPPTGPEDRAATAKFDLAQVGKPAAAPVQPPAAPAAQAASPRSFADAFGDLGAPVIKPVPASGAVDIRKIAPARPASAKAEMLAKPVHPSRIWIQVGIGRDKSALSSTWKSLVKESPDVFRGKSPAITDWGKTNRLLTGPFDTTAAANALVAKLKRDKVNSFLWTSPAGQVVDPLAAR